jgi:catechol 2,3-dioxygenase-like lactoylglutathione lyase family enzyme
MGLRLRNVVLDTTDVPRLAEFYRELLGWPYADGFEPAPDDDWRTLVSPQGLRLGFQQAEEVAPTTWPDTAVPQQLHLDLLADSVEELATWHERALGLGATLRLDRSDEPEEPLRVYADPAGHTFCIFAWPKQDPGQDQ